MPQITYNILSGKNSDLPISPSEVESLFFFGIPIKDKSGSAMSQEDIRFQIREAAETLEGYLNCKLTKQVIVESQSYYINDYKSWGYIPSTYPIICPESLAGRLGTVQQVVWPKSWLNVKQTNDGIGFQRKAHIVPAAGSPESNSVVYSGVHLGVFGSGNIPNYWSFTYVTSFNRIPEDILGALGKMAVINIFHQLGDIILGAGIASQSLGIDGLSQSIATTSSATNAGYGARITGYLEDLKKNLPRLKSKYDGITFTCL